jgi:hypothetical protein
MCPMNPRLLRPTPTGFDPRRIAGAFAWYDASQPARVTLNGSNVSEWQDIIGGRHLSQATAANQPAYTTAGQNGRNCITYTSTGRALRAATAADWEFLHDGSSLWGIYLVASCDSVGGSGQANTYLSSYSVSASTYNLRGIAMWHDFGGIAANNNIRFTISSSAGLVARRDLSATGAGITRAYEVLGDPANATSSSRLAFKNQAGTTAGNTNGTTTAEAGTAGGAFTVGNTSTGTAFQHAGKICELIVYKRSTAITATESTAILEYLKKKWAL